MAIISSEQHEQLKTRFHFAHGLRFEIFYALQTLTDDDSRIHTVWKTRVNKQLPAAFWQAFTTIGGAPVFWPLIADAFQTLDPSSTYEEIITYLTDLDPNTFRDMVLIGALHNDELVDELVRGASTLDEVITRSPEAKQPWFACLGIYPYNQQAPAAIGLQRLVEAPDQFKQAALRGIDLFWHTAFAQTWAQAEPQLVISKQVQSRFFDSSSPAEFINQIMMRLEIDEENRVLRALRGGCILPFDEIEAIYVLPSLFNDSRLWTTYEHDGEITVYLPYFDPSIDLAADTTADREQFATPELDPALIFKALGDNTRYALACLIGAESRTAVELAKILKVSKPTISHHVHLLREAGLLNENYTNGSVQLSLKRDVIEALSTVAVGKLFKSAV